MKASAPCAMIQCAMDCSRYCSVLPGKPSSFGGECDSRAESPMRNGFLSMPSTSPQGALTLHDFRQGMRGLQGVAQHRCVVHSGDDIVAQLAAGIVGAQLDGVLFDAREARQQFLGDAAVFVAARIDVGAGVAEAAGLEAVEGVDQ